MRLIKISSVLIIMITTNSYRLDSKPPMKSFVWPLKVNANENEWEVQSKGSIALHHFIWCLRNQWWNDLASTNHRPKKPQPDDMFKNDWDSRATNNEVKKNQNIELYLVLMGFFQASLNTGFSILDKKSFFYVTFRHYTIIHDRFCLLFKRIASKFWEISCYSLKHYLKVLYIIQFQYDFSKIIKLRQLLNHLFSNLYFAQIH